MSILIGYVPAPEGEAALEAGLAEAAALGQPVVIVNSPRKGSIIDPEMADAATRERLLVAAEERGVEASIDQGQHGADLVQTFEELVEKHAATRVVIGLRRRSAVGKLVLGSDAQRLLLGLDVPILAVKPSA
ncbi:universal stress protein [Janibacter sp. YIM B02568]|uniref:universal stress protein n=1 Tax=Janibacter endophyticus TaxID=2806261 RepID=UPI00195212C2|nr:universal stress protein [Janibacter endophyticus]MBM6545100.1 universal stress protein [Janibacter endophyticus]